MVVQAPGSSQSLHSAAPSLTQVNSGQLRHDGGNHSKIDLCALVQMEEVLGAEEEEAGWALGSAFATAVMVQMNRLPVEALQPVRWGRLTNLHVLASLHGRVVTKMVMKACGAVRQSCFSSKPCVESVP